MATANLGGSGPYPPPVVVAARPAARLASATSALLIVMMLASVAGAVTSFQRAELYQEVLDGSPGWTRDDFVDSEKWVVGAWLAVLGGQVIVGPVFIAWQRSHAHVARALGARARLGPGWAVGGWFVPVASAVLPAVQLHQSSKASSPGKGNARLIALWMASFTTGSWTMVVWSLTLKPVNSPPFGSQLDWAREARFANQLGAAGFLLLAVAAVAGAVMVQSLTRRQMLEHPDPMVAPGFTRSG